MSSPCRGDEITEMENFLREVGFTDIKSEQMAPPSPFIMVSGYKR